MKTIGFILALILFLSGSVKAEETSLAETASEFDELETEIKLEDEDDKDPLEAPVILMRIRDITPEEILDAYLGTGNWEEEKLTSNNGPEGSGIKRCTYKNDNVKLCIIISGPGFITLDVSFLKDMPEEEELKKEWTDLFAKLDIPLYPEYALQIDVDNGGRHRYAYYLQANGIKICPDNYYIGGKGNEIDYFGQSVIVYMERKGYFINFQRVSDVIESQEPETQRPERSIEELLDLMYDMMDSVYQIPGDLVPFDKGTEKAELMYLMVDIGADADEYVFDLGYYVKQNVISEDTAHPSAWAGYVDGTLPFCYAINYQYDYSLYYQEEYFNLYDK